MKEKIEYELNMDDSYKDIKNHDEWAMATLWIGNKGVEYNFCVEEYYNHEVVNESAFYKMEFNEEEMYADTDHDSFVEYEIEWDKDWEKEFYKAMLNAFKKLHPDEPEKHKIIDKELKSLKEKSSIERD